jgi:hypothetical protein
MAQPKQYTIGSNLSDKELVADFRNELTRSGAVKGSTVKASEREVVEIALKIATDHRFDKDGKDRFQKEWQGIIDRDHADKGVTQIEKLKAEIAELKAAQANAPA